MNQRTNCARIEAEFGYVYLCVGDLLREERASTSGLGESINAMVAEGRIVPSEVIVRLIRQAMEKAGTAKFLIDGFPRNRDNLQAWEKDMAHCVVEFVLVLECSEQVSFQKSPVCYSNQQSQLPWCLMHVSVSVGGKIMEKRVLERGKTSGRIEDSLEAVRTRFQVFRESTVPVLEHYENLGMVQRTTCTLSPASCNNYQLMYSHVMFRLHEVAFGGRGSSYGIRVRRSAQSICSPRRQVLLRLGRWNFIFCL